jgi:hypothetical protein
MRGFQLTAAVFGAALACTTTQGHEAKPAGVMVYVTGDIRKPTLNVLVYDYTRLPISELEDAMVLAQGIFLKGGVATQWIKCAAVHESGQGSGCLEALGMAHVMVNIVSSDWRSSAGRRDRMGTALQDAKGRLDVTAYVFEDGVERVLQSGGCDRFQVLGQVMAHEVGHLLLGAESHSETGIMQSHWAGSQMARDPGRVTFTPDQARRIRVNIKTRMQERSSLGIPSRVLVTTRPWAGGILRTDQETLLRGLHTPSSNTSGYPSAAKR